MTWRRCANLVFKFLLASHKPRKEISFGEHWVMGAVCTRHPSLSSFQWMRCEDDDAEAKSEPVLSAPPEKRSVVAIKSRVMECYEWDVDSPFSQWGTYSTMNSTRKTPTETVQWMLPAEGWWRQKSLPAWVSSRCFSGWRFGCHYDASCGI